MPQRDYQRLGGWLLFFTVTLSFGLGMNVISLLQILTSGVQLDPVGTTLTVACMVAQGALIYQVVGRRPSYWQVLIVLVVLLTILDLFLLMRMEDPVVFVPTVFLDILRNVIWLLYFRRSRRVAVYFGKNNGFGMSGEARVCPRCGNSVSEDALFCGRCGSPLR